MMLEALSALNKAEEPSKRAGWPFDPWHLPHDPAVFDAMARGETATVFQFDTPTVRPYLIKIKPKSIEDLAAITSLCRPGCLDAPYGDGRTLAEVYVARANGEEIAYAHQDLESILAPTYGIQIYQEQSMAIFKKLANYSDEQAEVVRRGIGKKEEKVLKSCMADLRAGCLARGWNDGQITLLIDQIMASARYAFNKSHAVSYAYVAYACMYLKLNYKFHWWKSVLTNASKEELTSKFWKDVKDFVQPPDINKSGNGYIIDGETLVAPIYVMNGVGEKAYEQLVKGAPYRDIEHFVSTHLGKRAKTDDRSAVHVGIVYKLAAAGILDSLFPPEIVGSSNFLVDKLEMIARLKSEVRKEKREPIPEQYRSVNRFGHYRIKKELVSMYSMDLRDIVLPTRGGYQDEYKRWWVRGLGSYRENGTRGDLPIVDGHEMVHAKEMAEKGVGIRGMRVGVIAFVVTEEVRPYAGKTKRMTKLLLDAGGTFYEEVFWPPWGESSAPSGFKGKPVLVVYKCDGPKVQVRSVIKLIDPTQEGRYDVL